MKGIIGSVSHATMRPEDLIPTFADVLAELADDDDTHAQKLIAEANAMDDYDGETAYYVLEELFDALNGYAMPYFYFGAHEGDGSDYGFWLSTESIEDDVIDGNAIKVNDLAEIPLGYIGNAFVVTDHGNISLYNFERGKEPTEVWAIV